MTKNDITFKLALQHFIYNQQIDRQIKMKWDSPEEEREIHNYKITSWDHKNSAIDDTMKILGIKEKNFRYMYDKIQTFVLCEQYTIEELYKLKHSPF